MRILDLARTLIRLSGKSEHEVGIRFTGLRGGEKLFEELSYPSEKIHPTSFPKIRQIRGTPQRGGDLERHLAQLRNAMSFKSAAAIRAKVKEIVPEYSNGLDAPPQYEASLITLDLARAPQFSGPLQNPGDPKRYTTPRL